MIPPGSRLASALPRPTPKGPGVAGSTAPRPSLGGKLFPGFPVPSRPPAPLSARPLPPPPPLEAPPPPGVVPAEEISSSLLMPDDSGAAMPLGSGEPEELSGSLLIEDAPDGKGLPTVTKMGPAAPAAPAAAPARDQPMLAAHRTLLGMPELPTSTPAPVLHSHAQVAQVAHVQHGPPPHESPFGDPSPPGEVGDAGAMPASDEPVHTHTAGGHGDALAYGAAAGLAGLPGEEPAAYDHAHAGPSEPPVLPKNDFTIALTNALERARVLLARLRKSMLASAEDRPGVRPQWTIPAVTVAGLFVGIGVVALFFSLTGKRKGPDEETAASASASALASAQAARTPASATTAPAILPPPAAPPAAVTACTVTAASQIVAPAALVAAGVEVRSFGDGIALGFAPSEHEARGLRVDPVTLAASGGVTSRATDTIRRVRPIVTLLDSLGLAVDAERKRDRVHGRRTLPIDPPLQVGSADGEIVWMRAGGPPAGKLWPFPGGSDDIDAVRAASEGAPGDTTTAIVFRHGTEIWAGAATGYRALSPKGDLSHVSGLGPSVGSPAVGVNDGSVVVVWSDRASPDEPWHLRMVHMKAGEAASEPVNFTPPPGGPGGHVMSPSLAAIPGGRFLLVWTEGPTSQQRVRAVTLNASGEPVGKALEISKESVNSGQGQAAVTATAGAKGIVAFLQAVDGGFEIAATGIGCDS